MEIIKKIQEEIIKGEVGEWAEFWEDLLKKLWRLIEWEDRSSKSAKNYFHDINNLISKNKLKIEEFKQSDGLPVKPMKHFNLLWNDFEDALQNQDKENLNSFFNKLKDYLDNKLILVHLPRKEFKK